MGISRTKRSVDLIFKAMKKPLIRFVFSTTILECGLVKARRRSLYALKKLVHILGTSVSFEFVVCYLLSMCFLSTLSYTTFCLFTLFFPFNFSAWIVFIDVLVIFSYSRNRPFVKYSLNCHAFVGTETGNGLMTEVRRFRVGKTLLLS